jgi:hypothetical protein
MLFAKYEYCKRAPGNEPLLLARRAIENGAMVFRPKRSLWRCQHASALRSGALGESAQRLEIHEILGAPGGLPSNG